MSNCAREELVGRCLGALAKAQRAGRRGVVLIDGRSGSGKTTLAMWLAPRIRAGVPDLRLLHLEDWYPGWDGLADGSRILAEEVLAGPASYRRWDWEANAYGPRVDVEPHVPLLVEGCGALTPRTRELADLGIWVDAEANVRRTRALSRDGTVYAPHWRRWAAQEDAHIARNDPVRMADVCVTTSVSGGGPAPRGPQGARSTRADAREVASTATISS